MSEQSVNDGVTVPPFYWVDRCEQAERRVYETERTLRRSIENEKRLITELSRYHAAIQAVTRDHYPRTTSVRSLSCPDEIVKPDGAEVCDGTWDPACSESCFAEIEICNACGTQGECKVRAAIAAELEKP